MPVTLRQCVGVTASQHGLTERQLRTIYLLLKELKARGFTQLRHGDCIEGDEDIALIAWAMRYEIVGHPPTKRLKRAFFPSDFEEPPEPYIDRNHRIVQRCQYVIAAPRSTNLRVPYSGTCATIKYAVGFPRAGNVVWPAGTTTIFSQLDYSRPVPQG